MRQDEGIATSGLSVVIPAYNVESWIGPTIAKLEAALQTAGLGKVEIIIVDDGSQDATAEKIRQLQKRSKHRIVLIEQDNQGRFLARKNGVIATKYATIFFLDSRVWTDVGSLKYVIDQQREHPDRRVWNGHVNVAKEGNIIARFGDAVTFIGWRRYFGNPRLTSYGLKDFDYYPKGTGFFLVPREVIIKSIAWFESVTTDIKNSSDDTLLIRNIAKDHAIWLSPEFSCTYHARTTLKAFIKHTYFRGQFFIDGFLRKGTRFYYPLLIFLALCPIILAAVIVWPLFIIPLIGAAVFLWFAGLLVALMLKVYYKDSLSLWLLSPVFAVAYGAGLWRGVIRKVKK